MPEYLPGANPFFYEGGSKGFLLIHGFASSPVEMDPLGRFLVKNGYTVKGVLLPGHGISPSDLAKTRWHDWYSAVEAELISMKNICTGVYVVGFSMGGLLALHTAYNNPDLNGLIVLNTPVWFRNKKIYILPLIKLYRKYYPAQISCFEKEASERYNRKVYDKYPVAGVESIVKLIRKVKGELSRIGCPALVGQSKKDKLVVPKGSSLIYERLGSDDKKLLWYKDAGHIITLDERYMDQLHEDILDFANTH